MPKSVLGPPAILVIAAAVMAAGCQRAEYGWATNHSSPVGAARVEVFPAPEATRKLLGREAGDIGPVFAEVLHWANESALLIRARRSDGYTMTWHKRAFFSTDSDHGSYVVSLAWSPDGRYLAYQTNSSGGHQPYHWAVSILDVKDGSEMLADENIERLPGNHCACATGFPHGERIFWDDSGRLHFQAVHFLESSVLTAEYAFRPKSKRAERVSELSNWE